jgi:hypothetical protein
MKLEDILKEWEQDSVIKREILDEEALRIPVLHKKYHTIYTHERLILRKLEVELKVLKLDKYEFFTQGPNSETEKKGWVLPPIGKIIKSDVQQYIDCDKQVVELTLRVGTQHEKIELLDSIIKSLRDRGFQIRSAIDWIKFTSGA